MFDPDSVEYPRKKKKYKPVYKKGFRRIYKKLK
jgi:hypothetical protein